MLYTLCPAMAALGSTRTSSRGPMRHKRCQAQSQLEPLEERATPSVLADSVADFSGVQGHQNWCYGYYEAPLAANPRT